MSGVTESIHWLAAGPLWPYFTTKSYTSPYFSLTTAHWALKRLPQSLIDIAYQLAQAALTAPVWIWRITTVLDHMQPHQQNDKVHGVFCLIVTKKVTWYFVPYSVLSVLLPLNCSVSTFLLFSEVKVKQFISLWSNMFSIFNLFLRLILQSLLWNKYSDSAMKS